MLTLFTYVVLSLQLYDAYPWLHVLPFGASFITAPSFYLFIKYLVNPGRKFKRIELLHFSPIILNYLHSIYHLIYGRTIYHIEFHNFTEAIQLYAIIPGSVYLYLIFREIKKNEENILNHFSNLEKRTLSWSSRLLYLFGVIYGLTMVFIIVDNKLLYDFSLEFNDSILMPYDELLVISYAVALYWSTIETYNQQQSAPIISLKDPVPIPEKNYEMFQEKIELAVKTEKLYLNPDLSLRLLEDNTQLSSKDISLTLNHHLNMNFYEYVNSFRVEEAKQKLINPQYNHLTIEAIGYESGFNSKATFNRIFKNLTGQSPGNYKASNKK